MKHELFLQSALVCGVAVASLIACSEGRTQEPEFKTVELENGRKIEYAVVLPEDIDPEKTYPVLLALPPGAQNKQMVKAGLNLYWNAAAENGWIVVSPVAPDGKAFNKGSEDLIPEFLKLISEDHKPEGGKFHLAGVSNGGTSAFRVAGKAPQLFHSLMALPGFPPTHADEQRLEKLKSMPIAMYVGQKDTRWVKPMKKTANILKKLGAEVQIEIIEGEGHVIQNWQDGKKLFGLLNKWRENLKKSGSSETK